MKNQKLMKKMRVTLRTRTKKEKKSLLMTYQMKTMFLK
jgi:hypothetical protein